MNSKALMINTYITIYCFVCVQFRILKQKFSLLKRDHSDSEHNWLYHTHMIQWTKTKTVLTACNICLNATLKIMLDMHVKKKSRVKKDAYINEFTLIM